MLILLEYSEFQTSAIIFSLSLVCFNNSSNILVLKPWLLRKASSALGQQSAGCRVWCDVFCFPFPDVLVSYWHRAIHQEISDFFNILE